MLIILTFVLPGGIVAGVRKIKARIVQVVPSAPAAPTAAVVGEPIHRPANRPRHHPFYEILDRGVRAERLSLTQS